MPLYKANNKIYNIPYSRLQDFYNAYPDATDINDVPLLTSIRIRGGEAQKTAIKEAKKAQIELSDSEQFQNIFLNALDSLKNAWKSTQVASYEFANYLGIGNDEYVDNFIEEKYKEIYEINKNMRDTGKGIVGGFQEGDMADVALGITNALVGVVTTVVPALATKGVSLIPQIMAPMYTEYNAEKAARLYGSEDIEASIEKLRDNGELEVALPLALGTASVALERIGIKGIQSYFLRNIKSTRAEAMGKLFLTGNREGLTEYVQGGLNVANISSAKGEKDIPAKVFDHMTDPNKGIEEFIQGFVGGVGMSSAGRALTSAFRDDKDNIIVNDYINLIGSLQQKKLASKTQEGKNAIDKKIKKAEKDFKNFIIQSKEKSQYITKEQSEELLSIIDTKRNLNKKLEDFQKQVKNNQLSKSEFDTIVEDINNSLQAENEKLNAIRVEANKKFLMDDLRTSETAINKILGLEQKTYKTKKEFLDAYNAKTGKNLTLKDIEGVDGVKVDNEIMINVEEAAENNAVTVGSHELLHGILKSSLTSKELREIKDKNGNIVETDLTVEGEQLIRDFLNTLTKKERAVVDKRINDNYKYNRDKDGNIISEKAFAQYAEEYLNAYADAAIKNQLTDSILTKIKNFLEKIFNKGDKGYKNLEFKTGEDVKAFLKAYVSDRKKGEFRQQFIEMAQEGAKRDTVVETKRKPRYSDDQVSVKRETFTQTMSDGKKMKYRAITRLDGSVYFQAIKEGESDFSGASTKLNIKAGDNITPKQRLEAIDTDATITLDKTEDYKSVMNPKMFDRLTSDQQQRVDPKRAKKTAPKKSKTIEKKSLSSAARQQISDSIKEIGGTYSFEGGKKAWDEGGADNAIQEIRENGYLDDLIAAKFKGDKVPVDFVDKVYTELTSHIRNFNPETNDNLFGWINSQLANKAGNVFNREYKTTVEQRTAKDVDDRTKEGEVKIQVAAEEDARIKAFEEEDISPQAEARRKAQADKKQIDTKSKLRQELNIEDGSDVYNKVLETARKVLIRAYDAGKTARQIQRDLTKEASAYLFKQVKNMLGAKDKYIPTIKKLRVSLINSMFTADLVQMERNVPDNEKVFTRFIKNLTSKQEVQDAVDRNELLPSALNTIDKGQSVALYEKVMPTEQQFIDFFDQPLVNPKTGARSGLRGTRKDQLAKYVAASLNFDATMQVAQEPDVAEKRQQMAELRGETMDDTDIQVLSATINRDPSVKFHKSSKKPVVDKNLAYHIKEVLRLDNITKQEDFKEYSEGLVFKVPGQGVTINDDISDKDKALFAREAYRIRNDGSYERNNDKELDDFVLNGIEKARKDGKVETRGKILENASKDIVNKNTKGKLTDGNGDIYVDYSGVIFGIEAKGGFAQWVSRTLNAIGDTLSFTTKNDTIDKTTGRPFEEAIIEKVLEVRKEINDFLKDRGLNPIKDFNKPLDVNSKEFEILKTFKSSFQVDTTVSLEYVMRDYILNKYFGNNAQSLLLVDFNAYLMETDSESYRNAKVAVDIFNEGKPVEQQIIPLQLNKETDAITVHVSFQVSDSGVMNHRFRPKLDDNQFKKSNVNLFKDAKVAKEFGQALDDAARIINLSKIDKSISNSRPINKYSKTSRGMSAFDFDETLIDKGDNFIIATSPSGKEIKITSAQWPIQGSKLAEQGYTFDFKDFVNVRGGVDGPLLQKLKNRIKKYGAKNNYILTARPPASATAIHGWLKTKGINIPLENITGLGNSTGEAKALWIAGKYAEGYNDIYFVDDALPNVKAVKNVLDQLDIKGKSVQARIKFSKSLNKEFNDIIEDVKGIDSKKRFSNAKGRARGQGKGRFRFFIPPSHEDFVGVLYNFIGFGEKGNKHRDFFEKALIRPLNRAYRKLNQAKQAIASNYKELLKSMPDVRRRLGDKILKGDYTVEDAIRVYLFDKAGHEIPGLSKTDLKNLTEYVKSDPMLQSFADTIGEISQVEEGYISPGDSWQASNIRYDLVDATGRVGRAKFFTEFQENADIIFSDENINKIRAAFGDNVVESLQDILYRTKTGTNRPTGNNRIVNRFMDWINGSVGATMFFNARSAVLQTLSTVNFLNFGDNNLFKAAKAFANQKQFWADFSFIFNSDYLKQRRTGAAFDVNANEIAREVAGSKNPVLAAIKYLLNIGFLPTQIADSFAIATGGATFYRNRVNTYIKQGLSQKEAESKAFIDFQAIAEETQQSARPDMISSQQASPLGRVILAFQNVTAQYARLIKKASLDLINRRKVRGYQTQWQSDLSNVSRIIYYGGIQNLIFYGLQTALFAMMFDDEDEKDEKFFKTKKDRIINGTVDSILRGIGVGGAVISTIKNAAIKWRENQGKGWNKEDNILMLELLQLSPPIGIKARKLRSFEKTMQYNEKVIKNMDIFDFDNPIYSGYSNLIEAVTNIPVARLHRKVENLRAALDSQNQWWQRLAVGLGWSKWDVGVENTEIQEVRQRIKETNKQINKETKLKKKYPGKTKQEIDILETEKTVFNLNKREQERILKQNGLNPKSYRLEKDRVDAIMKLRNKNKSKIDKQISDIENYVPSKSEQRELDLFKMNKKEQVNMLMDLGLSSKEIKKLKYEEDRVNKILALEKKSKKR